MPANYSAARFSYAKVLVVLTLFIWPATSAATSGLRRMEVIPSPYASIAMNATFAPVSRGKQHLQSNAVMTAGDHTDEERARPPMESFLRRAFEKAANDKFTQLKIDTTDDNFLKSPGIPVWVSYVRSMYSHFPHEAKHAMFKTIIRYFNDNNALVRVLLAETKARGAKVIAGDLLVAQVREWAEEKKSADEVFKLLQLDQTNSELFHNPLYHKWENFARQRYHENADEKMTMTLMQFYKGEDFYNLVLTGTTMRGITSVFGRLLKKQVKKWSQEEKDATTVFELLQLPQAKLNLFDSELFPAWASFVKLRYPSQDEKEMISTLMRYYKDSNELDGVLVAGAKKAGSRSIARTIATNLLEYRIQAWLHADKTPNEIYELFKLQDTDGSKLFEGSLIIVWYDFIRSKYPAVVDVPNVREVKNIPNTLRIADVAMIMALNKYYTIEVLANILAAGVMTGNMKHTVESLQRILPYYDVLKDSFPALH